MFFLSKLIALIVSKYFKRKSIHKIIFYVRLLESYRISSTFVDIHIRWILLIVGINK